MRLNGLGESRDERVEQLNDTQTRDRSGRMRGRKLTDVIEKAMEGVKILAMGLKSFLPSSPISRHNKNAVVGTLGFERRQERLLHLLLDILYAIRDCPLNTTHAGLRAKIIVPCQITRQRKSKVNRHNYPQCPLLPTLSLLTSPFPASEVQQAP